jgi:RNA polymerase sigma factor (sigma-70 family)
MYDTQVLNMFVKDRDWLTEQPDMTPWKDGCDRLVGLLDKQLKSYSADVCASAIGREREEWPAYLGRLWQCLGYHWRETIENSEGTVGATGVAERIQSGKGYRRGGKLGGDPLRDVVLAVAMIHKDERAPVVFTEEYQGFARGLAAKIDRRLAADPDDWWFELLDHLAGYSNPKARLNRFFGRCALRNWLGTVAWNFLRRRRLPDGGPPDSAEPSDTATLPTDDESLQHFAGIVRLAVASLRKEDRLPLALVYVDRLNQKEAAAILGVHPAQVGRRLQRVLPELESAIKRIASERLSEGAFGGIFEDLRENPQAFGEILRRAIEQGREDES